MTTTRRPHRRTRPPLPPGTPEAVELAQLPAQQREEIERLDREVHDHLAHTPIEDEYTGRSPDEQAALDEHLDAEAEIAANLERAEDRRRILLLEEQLAETQDLVRKLMARGGGSIDQVAHEVMEQEAERERQNTYKRVREAGDAALITLHTHEDPNRNKPVVVCVNGHVWNVKRGEPTYVPACVLEVLDHAVRQEVSSEIGSDGNPRVIPRTVAEYPYSLQSVGRTRMPPGIERRAANIGRGL